MQLDLFASLYGAASPATGDMPLLMKRIDPACGMARFYVLEVSHDMFGGWCLIRRWGRIGSRGGQVRQEAFAEERSAVAARDRLRTVKQKRGYC